MAGQGRERMRNRSDRCSEASTWKTIKMRIPAGSAVPGWQCGSRLAVWLSGGGTRSACTREALGFISRAINQTNRSDKLWLSPPRKEFSPASTIQLDKDSVLSVGKHGS